jgi:hypothetical protein
MVAYPHDVIAKWNREQHFKVQTAEHNFI